jgi:hypothetical protein
MPEPIPWVEFVRRLEETHQLEAQWEERTSTPRLYASADQGPAPSLLGVEVRTVQWDAALSVYRVAHRSLKQN